MPTITINNFNLESTPSVNQIYSVKWRLVSDADSPGNYTSAPDVTVAPNGTIVSPTPYSFTVPVDNVIVKITNSCNTNSFSKEYYIDNCCPDGYTFNNSTAQCTKVDNQTANYVGGSNPITVCHYQDTVYSSYGTLFYKLNGYNLNGTYTSGNQPSTATTTPNAGGTYNGTVWGNPGNNTVAGRLNKTALWACSSQQYAGDLGFGFQISVPTTGVYYVGFGADNNASLIVDGSPVVQQSESAVGTQLCGAGHTECTFKYWHCYPVQLTSGIHLINVTGHNDSGTIGAFGCEIYNASEAVLTACTTASGTNGDTSLETTNLHRYIVFSTKDISDNTDSDLGNYTCSDSSYTLVKDNQGNYSCQKIVSTSPALCNSSKVGSLISPLYDSLTIVSIYDGTIKYLRCAYTLNGTSNVTYQTFSNAGYGVVLSLNSAPPVSGSQTPFPSGSSLTAYNNYTDQFYSGNTANIPLVCIQNEENNQGYWDLSSPTTAASDYINMLSSAITKAHNAGKLVSNGGMTGPTFKWMVWKDILDNQGSTAATSFANKVFDSGQVAGLSNWPNQAAYQNGIAFLQAVIPQYATLPLDYINFHWYEPSHDQILSNTSIDPSAILAAVSYIERVTGKRAINNELGQHNMADNIVPQLLDTLMNIHMPYIVLYDGDGTNAGTGDAYAFHNTDGTIRSNGVAIKNFLKTHQ